jgi:hypothetical protein
MRKKTQCDAATLIEVLFKRELNGSALCHSPAFGPKRSVERNVTSGTNMLRNSIVQRQQIPCAATQQLVMTATDLIFRTLVLFIITARTGSCCYFVERGFLFAKQLPLQHAKAKTPRPFGGRGVV